MTFASILYADQQPRDDPVRRPSAFPDLFLDQVVAAATRGRERYDLAPFFHRGLGDAADVEARQAVVRDLRRAPIADAVARFAAGMDRMRGLVAKVEERRHVLQARRHVLEAVVAYCDALAGLESDLDFDRPASPNLAAWQGYLSSQVASPSFTGMRRTADELVEAFARIRFTIRIDGRHVAIAPFDDEGDYGAELVGTYARFDQGGTPDFPFARVEDDALNFVEELVLEQVARAHPVPFARLADFVSDPGPAFRDPVVERFDREVQFPLAYLELVAPLASGGLPFCLPEVGRSGPVRAEDGFDLALALRVAGSEGRVVPNGFRLDEGERIIVVSGPNQGGKSTFARMFGQLHHLGALGLPVPGRAARLRLPDAILTHFERRELAQAPEGKLKDELIRLRAILAVAGPDSLVILNELFSSTTSDDAFGLSAKVADRLVAKKLLCVWVGFLEGLCELDDVMVSMASVVDPEDPARRTFRVERRPPPGIAYAHAIAERYGLTRGQIERRPFA